MKALAQTASPGEVPLATKLHHLVRAEFRVDRFCPDPDDPVLGRGRCAVQGCVGLRRARGLCQSHYLRWRRCGRPDLGEFTAAALPRRPWPEHRQAEVFDLSPLSGQLRLELAYALQRRHDERSGGLVPEPVAKVVQMLARSPARSLLDHPVVFWRARLSDHGWRATAGAFAFVAYAHRHLVELASGGDVDARYATDRWRADRLGLVGERELSFERLEPGWLRQAAKRWARFRLAAGRSWTTVRGDIKSLGWFAAFLGEHRPASPSEAVITRGVLETYLSWLAGQNLAASTRLTYLASLRTFVEHCRRHGWLPALPADATLYHEDLPHGPERLPRFIPEFVMSQLEAEDSLARLDPVTRHLIVVLMETGLRAGDACGLAFDCIVDDSAGWPCLRFLNSKVRAEQLIPLTANAAAAIRAQQASVAARWASPRRLFPAPFANPDGSKPFTYGTLQRRLARWQADINLRDDRGRAVRVTAHRFRHTVGTRLINSGVPQHVVQRLLGHASPRMTAVYAHLHDATVRAAFEDYAGRRVNIAGEMLGYDAEAPTAGAEWVKHNLARVQASLPNGYCGRPPQQDCPHPNACLTCPDFQTTPEFLAVHRDQADNTRRLIATAEADGRFRLAANHRQVLENLERIIPALEALGDGQP